MEDFITIVDILRKEINDYHKNLLQEYYKAENYTKEEKENLDENFIDDSKECDEYYSDEIDEINVVYEGEEIVELNYDTDVLDKFVNFIKNSKYKNIINLIILNDVYEFIKSKEISEIFLFKVERKILIDLENNSLSQLLNKINFSETFFTDLVSIFLEYNSEDFIEEDKLKNKKLIELSNNRKHIEKFKIYVLDDIQFQYKKMRRLH